MRREVERRERSENWPFNPSLKCVFFHSLFLISLSQNSSVDVSLGGVGEDAHDVVVAVQEKFSVSAAKFDLAATILGQENSVANLDSAGAKSAILEGSAGADSHDSAPVELLTLLGGGEDDAGLGLGLLDGLLDEDAVEHGLDSLEGKHFV